MQKIKQLDDKILQLKQRKEQAETKLACALLKKVQITLGKDTDVNLAILILEETWNMASEEHKEVWRKKADTFRNSRATKDIKLTERKQPSSTEGTKTEVRDE